MASNPQVKPARRSALSRLGLLLLGLSFAMPFLQTALIMRDIYLPVMVSGNFLFTLGIVLLLAGWLRRLFGAGQRGAEDVKEGLAGLRAALAEARAAAAGQSRGQGWQDGPSTAQGRPARKPAPAREPAARPRGEPAAVRGRNTRTPLIRRG